MAVYARIVDGAVWELFDEDNYDGERFRDLFDEETVAESVAVPSGIGVEQGWIYDSAIGFSPPLIIMPTEPDLESQIIDLISQLDEVILRAEQEGVILSPKTLSRMENHVKAIEESETILKKS